MCNPIYCTQELKPRLSEKEYFQLMKQKREEREAKNLGKCFDYKPQSSLPKPQTPTFKDRLELMEKHEFFEKHLQDLFPNFLSYSTFIAANKVRWNNEDEIRSRRKETFVKSHSKK